MSVYVICRHSCHTNEENTPASDPQKDVAIVLKYRNAKLPHLIVTHRACRSNIGWHQGQHSINSASHIFYIQNYTMQKHFSKNNYLNMAN